MSLRIEIRDVRLTKRLSVQAGTDDPAERDARRATLLNLLESERGRAIIERLRARAVTVEEIHKAARAFDLGSLEKEIARTEAPPIGIGKTIDVWMDYLRGLDRSPQTIAFYTSIAGNLERHFGVERDHGEVMKDYPVGLVSQLDGEKWLTGAKQSGQSWSPRTQTVAHSLARTIWDRAMTEDEEQAERTGHPRTIARNFWRKDGARKGIRAARIRRTRVEFLQRKDAARVLWNNRHSPYGCWIAIGLYAGLRGGEAANLRLNVDCDLKKSVLRIQGREGQFAWRTKTDNSARRVPIHPRLARWIRGHIRRGYSGKSYLFRQPGQNKPIDRGAWRVWTRRAFVKAGVRYGRQEDALVYHSLRHTFASWLTMKDVHPLKIAKLMGDTVEMVIKTYAHLLDDDLEEAIKRL